MFDEIKNHEELFGALRGTCSENEIGATFAQELLRGDGDIDDDRVLIIKVDHLYSCQYMATPPKSIDCLVIVQCEDGLLFDIYLIELRNVSKPRYAHPKEIHQKFRTVVEHMFSERYPEVFAPMLARIRKLKCYLVTDPYNAAKRGAKTAAEIKSFYMGTVLDAYGALPPIRFGGHAVPIEVMLPDPVIKGC